MKTFMQSFRALGTDIELRIKTKDEKEAEKLFLILWKNVFEFEKRFSRFIVDSELSFVNLNSGKEVQVSKDFLDIFNKSKYFYEITNGIFNPFILPELQRMGYEKSMTGESDELSFKDREVSSFQKVLMKENSLKIPKESALDFGGIGKGYLADKLSKILDSEKIQEYCLSLGGDISLKGDWEIEIKSLKKENFGSFKNLKDKIGIATSGVVRIKNSKKQKHLVGEINSKYEICTVVSKDSTSADVLASCFLIIDDGEIQKFVDKELVIFVLLQSENEFKIFGDQKNFKMS